MAAGVLLAAATSTAAVPGATNGHIYVGGLARPAVSSPADPPIVRD